VQHWCILQGFFSPPNGGINLGGRFGVSHFVGMFDLCVGRADEVADELWQSFQ
jgi:hypothetical protein